MAYGDMASAVSGQPASSSEYNKMRGHVDDLDTRVDAVEATVNASGTTAAGNDALSSRLGTGVTTASTATAQLSTLTTRTTDASTGNTALGTRVTTVETKIGAAPTSPTIHTRLSAVEATSGTGTPTVQAAPGNSGAVTSSIYTESRTGVAVANEAGVSFTAPASGKVKITWACGITAPAAGAFALASWVIRTGTTIGSGTVVQAADDTVVCQNTGVTAENSYMNFFLLSGLTAGSSYNVRMAYRVSGGSGTFNRPKILVEPVLA
jgi:hypothetical protein